MATGLEPGPTVDPIKETTDRIHSCNLDGQYTDPKTWAMIQQTALKDYPSTSRAAYTPLNADTQVTAQQSNHHSCTQQTAAEQPSQIPEDMEFLTDGNFFEGINEYPGFPNLLEDDFSWVDDSILRNWSSDSMEFNLEDYL